MGQAAADSTTGPRLVVTNNEVRRKAPYSVTMLGKIVRFLKAIESESQRLRYDVEKLQNLTNRRDFPGLSEGTRLAIAQDAQGEMRSTLQRMREVLAQIQQRVEQ